MLMIIDDQGHKLKSFHLSNPKSPNFVTCTLSPRGSYIYASNEVHELIVFNMESGKVEQQWKIHEGHVLGILHHPTLNFLLTYAQDGLTRFWKS